MELSSFIFKKNSYIFPKESFSYISVNETFYFSAQAQKIKKIHPKKISYVSGKENSKKKTVKVISSQKKAVLIFQVENQKKFSRFFIKKQNVLN